MSEREAEGRGAGRETGQAVVAVSPRCSWCDAPARRVQIGIHPEWACAVHEQLAREGRFGLPVLPTAEDPDVVIVGE